MAALLGQLGVGSLTTLAVFFLTLLFALPLALPVALARMSGKPLISGATNAYLLVMRGTPLILQLIFVYFAPTKYLGIRIDRFAAVIIAFTLNYAAYFAEIYRGGISAIPRGQYEAAAVLGLTRAQTFFKIILPQVIKRILPATGNEVITLVKDTALAQTIAVAEIFRVAQNASARQFSTTPIFVAGLFYFAMNSLVAKLFALAEKKLDYYR